MPAPKCHACNRSFKSKSGLTFHHTRCPILLAERAEVRRHMIAADAAAAAATAAAASPAPMPIPATDMLIERPPSPVVSPPSPPPPPPPKAISR